MPGEISREDYINHTDDVIIACRAQGHAWPKFKPGKVKSRNIKIVREHDGCYSVTATCRDCGMQRELITSPGGAIDFPAVYRYVQPDGYATPKGSRITRRECLAEIWRRAREGTDFI